MKMLQLVKTVILTASAPFLLSLTTYAIPYNMGVTPPKMDALGAYGDIMAVDEFREADFGGGLRLPLRFIYQSADHSQNPYGWAGFRLSALESRALPAQTGLFVVYMPSGDVEYFRLKPPVNGEYIWKNNNDTWTGATTGGWGDFTITRWDGWEIEFRNTLIYRMTTDKGRVLRWTYDSTNTTLVTSIYEPGGLTAVTVDITSDALKMYGSSTLRGAHAINVNGDNYVFRYLNGTLKDIEFPDGRKTQWLFEEFPDSTSRLTLTQESGFWRSWVFHSITKKGITDDVWNFTITGGEPNEEGLIFNRPESMRTRMATGEYESWNYTAQNSIQTIRDALGVVTVTYRYKTPGRLYNKVFKVDRNGTAVWRGVHDAITGDLLASYDANNKMSEFAYERFPQSSEFQPPQKVTITDPMGRTRSIERDIEGNIIEVVDAAGVKRKLEYDSQNRLTRVKNAANEVLQRYVYGDKDQILESYDALANKTSFAYSQHLGNPLLTQVFTPEGRESGIGWDDKGRMTSLHMPSGAQWQYTYVDNWSVAASVRDPLNKTTSFEYDGRLNRIKTTDPLNRITEVVYDDIDLPSEVKNALNHTTTFENNAEGDMKKLTDARNKTYNLAWSDTSERSSLTWPDSTQQTNVFDGNRNLTLWKSKGNIGIIDIHRNDAAEITGTTWTAGAESGNSTFTRNGLGQITDTSATTMGLTVAQSLGYNAEGQVSSLSQTVGNVTRNATITYDLNGRLSTLTYPAGFVIAYAYNNDGQIETIKKDGTTIATYAYDTGGRLATRTLSSGVVTTYTYDAAERLDSVTVSQGSTVLWAERYGYNNAGERIYTLQGATGTVGDAYWLDATSQLRGVKYGVANASAAYSGISASTYSEWTFDQTGNRIGETGNGGTKSYAVNDINQYTSVTGVSSLGYSTRGDLTQFGDWTYTYDAAGNLIRAHNTQSNLLAKYWRDASGHRAVKDVDGEKSVFFNLGTMQLEAYDVATDMASSTILEPGIDRPLAEVSSSGTLTFYHQDWLGNVAMLTNPAGAKVQTYTYDVWGKPTGFDDSGASITPGNFASRFLFTAREYDVEIGLYHYRARAYSPTLGRFIQSDPIDFSAGDVNVFRYVSNNPVKLVDPFGLQDSDSVPPPFGFEAGEAIIKAIITIIEYEKTKPKPSPTPNPECDNEQPTPNPTPKPSPQLPKPPPLNGPRPSTHPTPVVR